jgi:Alpha galactosidase C-terminal beta sandwich domain
VQAERVRKEGDLEYFVKPLANGDVAVAMLNAGSEATTMRVDFARDARVRARHVYVRDLWQHRPRGFFFAGYTARVRSHETVVLRLSARR